MALLIRNGCVVTGGTRPYGVIPHCDVLVHEGLIAAIAPGLSVAGRVEVVDATGMVVLPGFVDAHRHTWQTVLREMLSVASHADYLGRVRYGIAAHVRPEDVYAGTLIGANEALDTGVTTLADWSDATNTPEHADAAIEALTESGIRAVYAHGVPAGLPWWRHSTRDHPADARRVREEHFPSNRHRLTFALALRGPEATTPDVLMRDWRLARDLDARIVVHAGAGDVAALERMALPGPDTTYVHCGGCTDNDLEAIEDSGAAVAVSPHVELAKGLRRPGIGRLLAHGIRPALGVDLPLSAPDDMFTPMRAALAHENWSVTEVLRAVAVDGAVACGLAGRVGSLTVGREADIVLVRATSADPVSIVVGCADASDVDSVFVAGRALKRHGRLVHADPRRLRALAERSVAHLSTARVGFPDAERSRVGPSWTENCVGIGGN